MTKIGPDQVLAVTEAWTKVLVWQKKKSETLTEEEVVTLVEANEDGMLDIMNDEVFSILNAMDDREKEAMLHVMAGVAKSL